MRLMLLLLIMGVLSGCGSFKPQALDYSDYQTADKPSAVKQHTMSYGVYTPPNWSREETLPLVVFFRHFASDLHLRVGDELLPERTTFSRFLTGWYYCCLVFWSCRSNCTSKSCHHFCFWPFTDYSNNLDRNLLSTLSQSGSLHASTWGTCAVVPRNKM